MKKEIKVPAMGESITEATVGELFKANGSAVKMDEEILELETDKVNQVLYAPQDGVVNFTVAVDDIVQVGQVVGYVDANGAAAATEEPAAAAPEPAAQASSAASAPAAAASSGSARVSKEAFVAGLSQAPAAAPVEAPAASPAPAPAPAPTPAPAAVAPPAAPTSGKPESRRRMPRIRQVIADRLVEAQHTTAMLTTFNEADMSAVMELRSQYKDSFLKKHGVKLGFMSFFVKACVAALKAVPQVNSYIDGGDLVRREYYDVGIAVGTERGLVVPVLQGCDQLSLAGIESSIGDYAKKAREGSISVADLQGGGFTITNGGIYGSLLSTPILNPPQCGILGMHKIQKRPVIVGDEVVVRPMMYLALSYDHRIVDGSEAVTFLVHVKDCIEDPSRLLLEL